MEAMSPVTQSALRASELIPINDLQFGCFFIK